MNVVKKEHHFACALSTSAAAIHNYMTINQSTSLISQVAVASSSSGEHKSCRRYRRGGDIPPPKESLWGQLETNIECDEMDFFMFIGLSRESFDLLVSICEATINLTPLNRDHGKPNETASKKRLYIH